MISGAHLSSAWDKVRTSYWFLPTLLSLVAAAASTLLLELDYAVADTIDVDVWWLYGGDADSARALMATIVGSMITVVSIVFSITIVTLTLASGQFGSRLLRMFMRDRGNQLVLAVFIATFVYSLLVMRSIRSAEDAPFVPYVSVTVAVVLVLISVGLLIYFIHHVSTSIQADEVIDALSAEANGSIQRLFPEELGEGPDAPAGEAATQARLDAAEAFAICADHEGYLQTVDADRLMKLTRAHDLQLKLPLRPGAFVTESTPVVLAWPRDCVNGDVEKALVQSVVLGSHRTLTQDAEQGILQLAEIGVRALSPGINDPFTALSCLDRLEALLGRLAGKRFPSPYRYDDAGHLRVVADIPSFGGLVDAALALIRENAGSSPRVLLRMLDLVDSVARKARTAEQRAVLREQARLIRERGLQQFGEGQDLSDLEERYRRTVASLDAASRAPLTRSA